LAATLNLGILAHVDAGKTTLTERLLYAAGVIDEIGSVDAGTTQTDSMELERQRGITIRSAVVSFPVDGVTVNLIDTPGHPDFIAEVERVLSVLDGAVLVISAVEGVQPQTRILMRALRRLGVPTLLFVNKIDRGGADGERVLEAISRRLTPDVVAMGSVEGAGTKQARFTPWPPSSAAFVTGMAEVLTGRNDTLLASYVNNEASVTYPRLRRELAAQSRRGTVHPVYFGSAVTGAGVGDLMAGLAELLPHAAGDASAPVSGSVFKIERGTAGEKVAYVRMFSGTVHMRERLRLDGDVEEKVTAISAFDAGAWHRRPCLQAGEIGKVWGLGAIQVGGTIGSPHSTVEHHFAPPMLETVVVPLDARNRNALRVALTQLAEQDPLINVRQDDRRQEISVSLYGEVQKEVILATLANDFGIGVTFRETTTICVERPARVGEASSILHGPHNPFLATIGLRIEPAPADSGIDFRLDIDPRTVPLFIYKSFDNFADTMGQYVRHALQEGLYGWQVTDCVVTMIESNYSSPDGPPSTRGPLSTAADFRKLTPMVVMRALERAGVVVCEPAVRVHIDVPSTSIGPVLGMLTRLRGHEFHSGLSNIEASISAAAVHDVQRQLPGLTGGEGELETRFDGYQPVTGRPPTRRRTMPNPLNLEEYLWQIGR
jgi:ribosomal protection tetracycline resistance protein